MEADKVIGKENHWIDAKEWDGWIKW